MSIVIDASVAVKWVIPEADSDLALALRTEELVSPAIWLAEASNALWRLVRLGQLAADQALTRMLQLKSAPVSTSEIGSLVEQALRLAIEIDHPVYDCLYLALAIDRATHVVTDDGRFARAADRPGLEGRVRRLGDEPATRRRRPRGGPSR